MSIPSTKPVTTAAAQAFWQRYFLFYDTLNLAIPYQRMLRRGVELLRLRRGEKALDAGTGTGNVAVHLANEGAKVVGIDFTEPALEVCRRKVPDGDFRFGDLTKPLELETGAFDKVICCCVLHLLTPDAQAFAVRELYRVLKPGGRCVVIVFAAGFRSLAVYFASLREHRKISDLKGTIAFAFRHSFNSARILYYVWRIRRRARGGQHHFLTESALREVFDRAGFRIELTEPTFASQCWNIVGVKPEAESR